MFGSKSQFNPESPYRVASLKFSEQKSQSNSPNLAFLKFRVDEIKNKDQKLQEGIEETRQKLLNNISTSSDNKIYQSGTQQVTSSIYNYSRNFNKDTMISQSTKNAEFGAKVILNNYLTPTSHQSQLTKKNGGVIRKVSSPLNLNSGVKIAYSSPGSPLSQENQERRIIYPTSQKDKVFDDRNKTIEQQSIKIRNLEFQIEQLKIKISEMSYKQKKQNQGCLSCQKYKDELNRLEQKMLQLNRNHNQDSNQSLTHLKMLSNQRDKLKVIIEGFERQKNSQINNMQKIIEELQRKIVENSTIKTSYKYITNDSTKNENTTSLKLELDELKQKNSYLSKKAKQKAQQFTNAQIQLEQFKREKEKQINNLEIKLQSYQQISPSSRPSHENNSSLEKEKSFKILKQQFESYKNEKLNEIDQITKRLDKLNKRMEQTQEMNQNLSNEIVRLNIFLGEYQQENFKCKLTIEKQIKDFEQMQKENNNLNTIIQDFKYRNIKLEGQYRELLYKCEKIQEKNKRLSMYDTQATSQVSGKVSHSIRLSEQMIQKKQKQLINKIWQLENQLQFVVKEKYVQINQKNIYLNKSKQLYEKVKELTEENYKLKLTLYEEEQKSQVVIFNRDNHRIDRLLSPNYSATSVLSSNRVIEKSQKEGFNKQLLNRYQKNHLEKHSIILEEIKLKKQTLMKKIEIMGNQTQSKKKLNQVEVPSLQNPIPSPNSKSKTKLQRHSQTSAQIEFSVQKPYNQQKYREGNQQKSPNQEIKKRIYGEWKQWSEQMQKVSDRYEAVILELNKEKNNLSEQLSQLNYERAQVYGNLYNAQSYIERIGEQNKQILNQLKMKNKTIEELNKKIEEKSMELNKLKVEFQFNLNKRQQQCRRQVSKLIAENNVIKTKIEMQGSNSQEWGNKYKTLLNEKIQLQTKMIEKQREFKIILGKEEQEKKKEISSVLNRLQEAQKQKEKIILQKQQIKRSQQNQQNLRKHGKKRLEQYIKQSHFQNQKHRQQIRLIEKERDTLIDQKRIRQSKLQYSQKQLAKLKQIERQNKELSFKLLKLQTAEHQNDLLRQNLIEAQNKMNSMKQKHFQEIKTVEKEKYDLSHTIREIKTTQTNQIMRLQQQLKRLTASKQLENNQLISTTREKELIFLQNKRQSAKIDILQREAQVKFNQNVELKKKNQSLDKIIFTLKNEKQSLESYIEKRELQLLHQINKMKIELDQANSEKQMYQNNKKSLKTKIKQLQDLLTSDKFRNQQSKEALKDECIRQSRKNAILLRQKQKLIQEIKQANQVIQTLQKDKGKFIKDIEELMKAQSDDKKKTEHDFGKLQYDKQAQKSQTMNLIKAKEELVEEKKAYIKELQKEKAKNIHLDSENSCLKQKISYLQESLKQYSNVLSENRNLRLKSEQWQLVIKNNGQIMSINNSHIQNLNETIQRKQEQFRVYKKIKEEQALKGLEEIQKLRDQINAIYETNMKIKQEKQIIQMSLVKAEDYIEFVSRQKIKQKETFESNMVRLIQEYDTKLSEVKLKELQNFNRQRERIEKEHNDNLFAKMQLLDKSNKQLIQNKSKLQSVNKQLTNLQTQNKSLQQSALQIAQLKQRATSIQKENENITKAKNQLEHFLNISKSQCSKLKQQIKQVGQEKSQVKKTLAIKQDMLNKIRTALDQINEKDQKVKILYRPNQESILVDQINEIKQKIITIQNQKATLFSSLQKAEDFIIILQNQINEEKQNNLINKNKSQEIERMANQNIEQLTKDIELKRKQIDELFKANEKMKQQYLLERERNERELQMKKKQISSQAIVITTQSKEIQKLLDESVNLREKLSKEQSQNKQISSLIAQERQINQKQSEEIKKVTLEYEENIIKIQSSMRQKQAHMYASLEKAQDYIFQVQKKVEQEKKMKEQFQMKMQQLQKEKLKQIEKLKYEKENHEKKAKELIVLNKNIQKQMMEERKINESKIETLKRQHQVNRQEMEKYVKNQIQKYNKKIVEVENKSRSEVDQAKKLFESYRIIYEEHERDYNIQTQKLLAELKSNQRKSQQIQAELVRQLNQREKQKQLILHQVRQAELLSQQNFDRVNNQLRIKEEKLKEIIQKQDNYRRQSVEQNKVIDSHKNEIKRLTQMNSRLIDEERKSSGVIKMNEQNHARKEQKLKLQFAKRIEQITIQNDKLVSQNGKIRETLETQINNLKRTEKILENTEKEKNNYYQSLSEAENYIQKMQSEINQLKQRIYEQILKREQQQKIREVIQNEKNFVQSKCISMEEQNKENFQMLKMLKEELKETWHNFKQLASKNNELNYFIQQVYNNSTSLQSQVLQLKKDILAKQLRVQRYRQEIDRYLYKINLQEQVKLRDRTIMDNQKKKLEAIRNEIDKKEEMIRSQKQMIEKKLQRLQKLEKLTQKSSLMFNEFELFIEQVGKMKQFSEEMLKQLQIEKEKMFELKQINKNLILVVQQKQNEIICIDEKHKDERQKNRKLEQNLVQKSKQINHLKIKQRQTESQYHLKELQRNQIFRKLEEAEEYIIKITQQVGELKEINQIRLKQLEDNKVTYQKKMSESQNQHHTKVNELLQLNYELQRVVQELQKKNNQITEESAGEKQKYQSQIVDLKQILKSESKKFQTKQKQYQQQILEIVKASQKKQIQINSTANKLGQAQAFIKQIQNTLQEETKRKLEISIRLAGLQKQYIQKNLQSEREKQADQRELTQEKRKNKDYENKLLALQFKKKEKQAQLLLSLEKAEEYIIQLSAQKQIEKKAYNEIKQTMELMQKKQNIHQRKISELELLNKNIKEQNYQERIVYQEKISHLIQAGEQKQAKNAQQINFLQQKIIVLEAKRLQEQKKVTEQSRMVISLREEISKLNSKNSSLQNILEQSKQQKNNLKSEMNKIYIKNAQLLNQVKQHQKFLDLQRRKNSQIVNLKQKLVQKQQEKQILFSNLEKAEDFIIKLQDEIEKGKQKDLLLENLNRELVNSQNIRQKLQVESRKQIDKLKNEKEESENKRKQLIGMLENIQRRRAEDEKQKQKKLLDLKAAQDYIELILNENKQMHEKLNTQKKKYLEYLIKRDNQIKQLKQQLWKNGKEIEERNQYIENIKSQLNQMHERLKGQSYGKMEIQRQFQAHISILKEEENKIKQENQDLNKKIKQATQKLKRNESADEKKSKQLEQLSLRMKAYENNLSQREIKSKQSLVEIQKHKKQLQQLRQINNKLQVQKNELENKISGLDRRAQFIQKSAMEEKKHLQETLIQLSKAEFHIEHIQRQISQLDQSNWALSQQNKNIQQLLIKKQEENKYLQSLVQQKNRVLQENARSYEVQVRRLEQLILIKESVQLKLQQKAGKDKQLAVNLQQEFNRQRNHMKNQLENRLKDLKDYKENQKKIEIELRNLKYTNEKLISQIKEIKQQNEQLTLKNSRSGQQFHSKHVENHQLQQQVELYKNELENSRQDHLIAESNYKQLMAELHRKQDKVSRLSEQMTKATAQLNSANQQIQQTHTQIRNTMAILQKLQSQFKNLSTINFNLEKDLEKLSIQNRELGQLKRKANQEIQVWRQKLQKAQAHILYQEQFIDDIEHNIQKSIESQTRCRLLETRILQLQTQFNNLLSPETRQKLTNIDADFQELEWYINKKIDEEKNRIYEQFISDHPENRSKVMLNRGQLVIQLPVEQEQAQQTRKELEGNFLVNINSLNEKLQEVDEQNKEVKDKLRRINSLKSTELKLQHASKKIKELQSQLSRHQSNRSSLRSSTDNLEKMRQKEEKQKQDSEVEALRQTVYEQEQKIAKLQSQLIMKSHELQQYQLSKKQKQIGKSPENVKQNSVETQKQKLRKLNEEMHKSFLQKHSQIQQQYRTQLEQVQKQINLLKNIMQTSEQQSVHQIKYLTQKLTDLQNQLKQSDERNVNLVETIQKNNKQFHILKQNLVIVEAIRDQILQENQMLTQQVSRYEDIIHQLQPKETAISQQIKQSHMNQVSIQKQAMQIEIEELKGKVQIVQQQKQQERKRYTQLVNKQIDRIKELQTFSEALDKDCSLMYQDLQKSRSQCNRLGHYCDQLLIQREHLHQEIKQVYMKKQQQQNQHQREVSQLHTSLQELQKQKLSVDNKLIAIQKKHEEIVEKYEDLTKCLEQMASERVQIKPFSPQKKQPIPTSDLYSTPKKPMSSQKSQSPQRNSTVKRIQQALNQSRLINMQLRQQIHALQIQNNRVKEANLNLETICQGNEYQLEELRRTLESLQKEIKNREQHIVRQQQFNEEIQRSRQILSQQNDYLRQLLNKNQKHLLDTTAHFESKIHQLLEKQKALLQQNINIKKNLQDKDKKIQKLHSAFAERETDPQIQKQINKVRRSLDSEEGEKEDDLKKNKQLKRQSIDKDKNSEYERIRMLQRIIYQLQEQVKSFQRSVQTLTSQLETYQEKEVEWIENQEQISQSIDLTQKISQNLEKISEQGVQILQTDKQYEKTYEFKLPWLNRLSKSISLLLRCILEELAVKSSYIQQLQCQIKELQEKQVKSSRTDKDLKQQSQIIEQRYQQLIAQLVSYQSQNKKLVNEVDRLSKQVELYKKRVQSFTERIISQSGEGGDERKSMQNFQLRKKLQQAQYKLLKLQSRQIKQQSLDKQSEVALQQYFFASRNRIQREELLQFLSHCLESLQKLEMNTISIQKQAEKNSQNLQNIIRKLSLSDSSGQSIPLPDPESERTIRKSQQLMKQFRDLLYISEQNQNKSEKRKQQQNDQQFQISSPIQKIKQLEQKPNPQTLLNIKSEVEQEQIVLSGSLVGPFNINDRNQLISQIKQLSQLINLYHSQFEKRKIKYSTSIRKIRLQIISLKDICVEVGGNGGQMTLSSTFDRLLNKIAEVMDKINLEYQQLLESDQIDRIDQLQVIDEDVHSEETQKNKSHTPKSENKQIQLDSPKIGSQPKLVSSPNSDIEHSSKSREFIQHKYPELALHFGFNQANSQTQTDNEFNKPFINYLLENAQLERSQLLELKKRVGALRSVQDKQNLKYLIGQDQLIKNAIQNDVHLLSEDYRNDRIKIYQILAEKLSINDLKELIQIGSGEAIINEVLEYLEQNEFQFEDQSQYEKDRQTYYAKQNKKKLKLQGEKIRLKYFTNENNYSKDILDCLISLYHIETQNQVFLTVLDKLFQIISQMERDYGYTMKKVEDTVVKHQGIIQKILIKKRQKEQEEREKNLEHSPTFSFTQKKQKTKDYVQASDKQLSSEGFERQGQHD